MVQGYHITDDGKEITIGYEFGIKIGSNMNIFIPVGTIFLDIHSDVDKNDPTFIRDMMLQTEIMIRELVGTSIIPSVRPIGDIK